MCVSYRRIGRSRSTFSSFYRIFLAAYGISPPLASMFAVRAGLYRKGAHLPLNRRGGSADLDQVSAIGSADPVFAGIRRDYDQEMSPATTPMDPKPDTPRGGPAPGAGSISAADFAALVEAARLAPSPDNNQPWAFRLTKAGIDLFHVRDRAIRSDVEHMFAWLAIGAAIENIALAASKIGHTTEVDAVQTPAGEAALECVTRLRLSPGAEPDPLADQMVLRTTNRKPYGKTPIEQVVRERLSAAADRPGIRVDWFVDRGAIGELSKLVQSADRIRFETPSFHEELFDVLRFSREDVERTRDGLDVRTLEMPRVAWPLIRWLRRWPRMRTMNRLGASAMFAKMAAQQVRATGALAIISTDEPGDSAYLEGGRAMQRLWLAASAEGLAVQPLGSVPLFVRAGRVDPDRFAAPHREAMRRVSERLSKLMPDAGRRTPVMLMRLGRCTTPPSARSMRYAADGLVLGGDDDGL